MGDGGGAAPQGQMAVNFFNEVVDLTETHTTLALPSVQADMKTAWGDIVKGTDANAVIDCVVFSTLMLVHPSSAITRQVK